MAENDGGTAFLKVQFSVKDEFGKLVETTDEQEAKAAGIFNEHARYGYSLIMLSDERLLKGFRKALMEASPNVESTVTFKKEDAFGNRDESLVVLVPQKKFEDASIRPEVGLVVELDGKKGRIQAVSGGRVRVDLNHELAGKDVIYKFKVLARLETPKEKIDALLAEQFNGRCTAKFAEGSASVSVTQDAMKQEDYLQGKYSIIQSALQFIPELKKIEWTEEFQKNE